jgi:hypothetical protein
MTFTSTNVIALTAVYTLTITATHPSALLPEHQRRVHHPRPRPDSC